MDMEDNTAFSVVNRYLGWGDPSEGGIWFVGIEEAGVWGGDNLSSILAVEEPIINLAKKQIKELDLIDGWYKNSSWEPTKSRLLKVIEDIADAVGVSRAVLWRAGCKVFQTNLYPLGRPRTRDWPPHYKKLFDFGKEDLDRYKKQVQEKRFPDIRKRWLLSKPKATICFGTSHEYIKGFAQIFLNGIDLSLKKHPQHKIFFSDETRVLISQHPSSHWWRKSGSDKEKLNVIKCKLRDEWKIAMP